MNYLRGRSLTRTPHPRHQLGGHLPSYPHMIINTDDYNEIEDYTLLEYYLEDSLVIRLGRHKPQYYVKKGSVPKLEQLTEIELSILRKLIQTGTSRGRINDQAEKIKNLKRTFTGIPPCEKLENFIKEWKML